MMQRRFVLAPGLAVLVALLTLGPIARPAAAQDATLPADGMQVAPGVTVEEVPSKPGNPPVYRIHLDPGASVAFDNTDPSISLVFVEQGTVAFTIAAPVSVTRAGAVDQPAEPVVAAVEFTSGPGDYFIAPANTAAQLRNPGSEPATVLVASILPSTTGSGTPSAGSPVANS
jgi:quercetin dioxygenase-like cupin family protein